jgi:4-hydroxybenzoate polyprenyltransferase
MTAPISTADRLLSTAFVRDYAITMRPYLLCVSGITGLVGLALGPALPLGATLLLSALFFLSYGFGQALTDCFQTDTDALSAPYRPLVQGRLERRQVLAVSLAGLLLSGVVVTAFHPYNLPLALVIVAGLASYTWFKRRWWAGPFWNAGIVAALAVVAWLCAVGWEGGPRHWNAAQGGTLAAVFFGYANFVLTGYWKDISADRATGYRTLPVVFGTRAAALVSHGFAAGQLAGVAVAVLALAPGATAADLAWAAGFLAPGAWLASAGQARLGTVTEDDADLAIAPVVHAYILLLAGVAALARPAWTPALWLVFLGWLVALALRPMRRQI